MKNRNAFLVFLLPFLTFGIYGIYWFVSTKIEMNKQGATIPTAWLIIIPLVNIYWFYKYCEGVDHVTGGKLSTVLAFILLWILGPIGSAIVQIDFNKLGSAPAVSAPVSAEAPIAPVATAATVPVTTNDQTPPAAPTV